MSSPSSVPTPSPTAPGRPARSGRRRVAMVALAALVAGCGGGDDAGPDGFSVAALLEEVPAVAVNDRVMLVVGDFDEAAEQSGRERPGEDATDEERITWMARITGLPEDPRGDPELAHVMPPEVIGFQQLARADEFADEVGWNAYDVNRYIEHRLLPGWFAVLEGDFDPDRLAAAIGEPADGIWRVGPDQDGSIDAGHRTAARPVGQAWRMAQDGDRLAVTGHTPAVEAWVSGDGGTLADDDELRAVAEALDDAGVYTAMIAQADWSVGGDDANPRLAEAIERSGMELLDPFTTLGVGLSVVEGEAVGTFVYVFDSDATAEANVARLEALVADGQEVTTGRPLAEMLVVRSVESDGIVLVVSLGFEQAVAGIVWRMVMVRETLVLHR